MPRPPGAMGQDTRFIKMLRIKSDLLETLAPASGGDQERHRVCDLSAWRSLTARCNATVRD